MLRRLGLQGDGPAGQNAHGPARRHGRRSRRLVQARQRRQQPRRPRGYVAGPAHLPADPSRPGLADAGPGHRGGAGLGGARLPRHRLLPRNQHHDLALGDRVPYPWTPFGNHIITLTGVGPNGSLLARDTASIEAPNTLRPGPRLYDADKLRFVSATLVIPPGCPRPPPKTSAGSSWAGRAPALPGSAGGARAGLPAVHDARLRRDSARSPGRGLTR